MTKALLLRERDPVLPTQLALQEEDMLGPSVSGSSVRTRLKPQRPGPASLRARLPGLAEAGAARGPLRHRHRHHGCVCTARPLQGGEEPPERQGVLPGLQTERLAAAHRSCRYQVGPGVDSAGVPGKS